MEIKVNREVYFCTDTPDAHHKEALTAEKETVNLPSIDNDEGEENEDKNQTDRKDGQHEVHPTKTDNENEEENTVEKPEPESPPRLPENFYYNAEEINAKPITTDEKTFPQNTLSM